MDDGGVSSETEYPNLCDEHIKREKMLRTRHMTQERITGGLTQRVK